MVPATPSISSRLAGAVTRRVGMLAVPPEDYQTLQQRLNSTQVIQPLDAATTKSNIYYITKRFMRYVAR